MKHSLLIGLAMISSTAAGAVTVLSPLPGPDQGPLASQTFVVDFEKPFAGLTGGTIYSKSAPGAAAPLKDKTHFLGVTGSATLDISAVSTHFDSFSFYWGSVDPLNTVSVYNLKGALIYTYLGSSLPSSTGSHSSPTTNRRVFFTLGKGETLGKVRFSYPLAAFEIDDVAFGGTSGTVPEPSVWAMAIAGFGIVGIAARLRRRPRATAKAVTA